MTRYRKMQFFGFVAFRIYRNDLAMIYMKARD